MNRREYLMTLCGLGFLSGGRTEAGLQPMQLHVDLEVEPRREKEMVENYLNLFRPAIQKQPGFVEVKLLKRRETEAKLQASRYRLLISFQREEQRKQWVATEEHQRVWPAIEKTLTGTKYSIVLFDVV